MKKVWGLLSLCSTVVLFLWMPTASFAQTAALQIPTAPTEVKVQFSVSEKATAGDLVVLKVSPELEYLDAMPVLPEQKNGEPIEWGSGRILSWKTPQQGQDYFLFYLTSYTPGKFEINSIKFQRNDATVFQSEAKSVEFVSLGKSDDPVYPPSRVAIPQWVWVMCSVVLLVIVLFLLLALAKWSRRKKIEIEALSHAPRILNAVEEFEQSKEQINQRCYLDQENYKRHYFALSEAAKRFISKKYNFDAEESTTKELFSILETKVISKELVRQWKEVFDEMDITKFTDQKPDLQLARSLAERLSGLVSESWRQGSI